MKNLIIKDERVFSQQEEKLEQMLQYIFHQCKLCTIKGESIIECCKHSIKLTCSEKDKKITIKINGGEKEEVLNSPLKAYKKVVELLNIKGRRHAKVFAVVVSPSSSGNPMILVEGGDFGWRLPSEEIQITDPTVCHCANRAVANSGILIDGFFKSIYATDDGNVTVVKVVPPSYSLGVRVTNSNSERITILGWMKLEVAKDIIQEVKKHCDDIITLIKKNDK